MARTYTVQENETVLDIALRELGTSNAAAIRQHARNQHVFAAGRSDRVLKSGDELWLPDVDSETGPSVSITTGRSHRLVARPKTRRFRVRLLDAQGTALQEHPFEVRPDKGPTVSSATDAQGWAVAQLLLTARSVTLATSDREYRITLGSLDPAHTTRGAQARLKNLGYWLGEVGDTHSIDVQLALRTFQVDQRLPATGVTDAATVARLLAEHGE